VRSFLIAEGSIVSEGPRDKKLDRDERAGERERKEPPSLEGGSGGISL